MQLGLPLILLISFALLLLIVFIVLRNRKDRKELEHTLNEDYERPRSHEDDEDSSA